MLHLIFLRTLSCMPDLMLIKTITALKEWFTQFIEKEDMSLHF